MATSLQRQLAALAAPASTILQPERKRVSIIFTSEEAAKYDKETFYQIGLDGLNELASVCPDLFVPYMNSILFAEGSKNFERAVEDEEMNEKVDQAVEKFLLTLSPYLMLKASLKCMEWLVYRFHIERFNIESIMQCVLPYYDTKHFVSIIQTLQFGSPQDPSTVDWQWLAPSIQSATTLRKASLHGNVNAPFVMWLFQTLKKLLEVHHAHHDNLSTYLGFMVSTIVGIVTRFSREFSIKHQYLRVKNKKTIVDVVLNQIYSLFEEILFEKKYGSFRHNREIFSIAYVMIAAIGVTAEENPEIGGILGSKIKRIFNLLIKNRNLALLEETYLLIDMLVHHIYFEWSFKHQNQFKTAMADLAIVSQNWDVSKVVSRLFIANCGNGVLTPRTIFEYLAELQLKPEVRSEILSKLYFTYKEVNKDNKSRKKWAKTILQRFERVYPAEFELACQSEPKLASHLAKLKDGNDLNLLVEHPDEAIRARAVRKLILRATQEKTSVDKKNRKAKNHKLDKNPTAQALLPRFADDSQEVITTLFKSKLKRLQKIFSTEVLLQGCITVLKNRREASVVRLVLKKICLLAVKVQVEENLEKQILTVFIPFLFPRKPPGITTAKKIICSKFAKQNAILSKYKPVAERINEVTPEEFCSLSYEIWTTLEVAHSLGKLDSAKPVELIISFLLLNEECELNNLLEAAAQIGFRSVGNFPLSPENFSKCLVSAEKKGRISLELILSKILNIKLLNVSSQLNVLKFVWSLSENVKYRGTCMEFMKIFLQESYPESNRQFWFWLLALHKAASLQHQDEHLHNETAAEFYLIRCLQFFSSFVKDFGIPAKVDTDKTPQKPEKMQTESQEEEVHKPLTRSRGKVEDDVLSQSSLQPEKVSRLSQKASPKKSGSRYAKDIVREGVSPTWCLLEVVLAECVQHPSPRVRRMSMKFLGAVRHVPKLSVDWEDLLERILVYENEIVADASQAAVLTGKAIVDADLTSVRSQIIRTILNEETDKGIFMGLVNVCQHTGSLIYSELEPMIQKLLDTDPESKQLLALLNCFEATPKSIEIVPKLLESKGTAKIVLKQLSNKFFKKANMNFRKQLYRLMVDSAVNCNIPEVKLGIQRCVRKWDVDTSLISEEIKKCMGLERRCSTAVVQKGPEADILNGWKDRAEVILEFVQGMKKVTNTKGLLAPLFRILKICISLEQQSSVEYLKQLTLTVLTMCCAEDVEEDQKIDSATFHVELVIDCLRCSRNPQTHHHALILLNYAAKRFQEQVLHGVMSLFTFMGNSILRQDDTYSTQLIQQTVTTIIPALTKAGKGGNPQFSRIVVSSGIFRVFASALQDIPVHRRLPVFTSLVETLEPSECLWQVLIIIVDNALNRDRKKSNLNADLDLAVDLAWHCGSHVVVKGLSQVYEFFTSLSSILKCSITEENFRRLKTDQSPADKAVFDFSRKENYQDIQRVIYYTIELILKVATKFTDTENESKLNYDVLLEKCLAFSKVVSGLNEDKIFRLIAHKNMEVVEKINAVLDAEEFVDVIAVALKRNEISIKRKLLDMFNLRMSQKIEWFGDLTILLPIIPSLLEIAKMDPINDETVTLIQTSFVSMKLIAKNLAFSHPDEFVPVFHLALARSSSHENHLLCASALLCLGELFCLKSILLPNLNDVTSAILRAFKASSKLHKFGTQLQQTEDDTMEESEEGKDAEDLSSKKIKEGGASITTAHLLCISTIACMNKMTEQMGALMGSKFLRKALILILTIDTQQFIGDNSGQRRKTFEQRLRVLMKSIATKIPIRNSIIPLKDAFSSLTSMPRAVTAIMSILKESLQVTAKPDFLLILSPLCDTFMDEFFAYRYNRTEAQKLNQEDEEEMETKEDFKEDEVAQVEDTVIDCLISGAVLKMSEGAFRPYYHRLYEWAKDSDVKLITFYRFSAAAAEKLKSLFVTFAGYVMNDAVSCLDRNVTLTKGVLSLFYHLFSNDREGFVTTDRFNTLVKPLIDLMESEYILTEQIDMKTYSDTLIQLAVASNDLNRWQHMIDLISTKAHHSDKRVRLNVIHVLEAAASELGKDFLPLLPPVVPFVAELMNDDEADVEAATQKMLLKLETIVGEPLQPYFT